MISLRREEQIDRGQDFYGSETIPSDRTRVDTCHYTFVKTYRMYKTQKINPNIKCGLCALMMYHSWFTNYNKCTILVAALDNSGGWWEGYMGTVFSTPLCCEPKTTLLKDNFRKLSDVNIGFLKKRDFSFPKFSLVLKNLRAILDKLVNFIHGN